MFYIIQMKGAIMASYSISTRQKDKGWQVIVSYKDRYGKWRQKSKQGFATKRQAKDYGDVIVKDIKEKLLFINSQEFSDITFIEFARLYFDDVKNNLRVNTLLAYDNNVKHLHQIHDMKLQSITPQIIHKIASEMPLSESTKHYVFSMLKTMFTHAIKRYNLMVNNPVVINLKKDARRRKRIRIISDQELSDYFKSADASSHYFIAVKILHYTGMRVGELLGLTWDNINFDNLTITINKQWVRLNENRTHGLGPLKTKNSYRTIPIPPSLSDVLLEYKARCTTDRLIPIYSPTLVHEYTKRHINKHTTHDFRHTYATKLLAKGVDIKTVASLLGDTVNTVIKTYIHYSDEMRENARTQICQIFD